MFIKFTDSLAKLQKITMHPGRSFVSSSLGMTGSVHVVVNRSVTQKDNIDDRVGLTGFDSPQIFDENTFEGRRKLIFGGENTPVGTGELWADWIPRRERAATVAGTTPTLNFGVDNFEGNKLDIAYSVGDTVISSSVAFLGSEANMLQIANRINSVLGSEIFANFITVEETDKLIISTVGVGTGSSITVSPNSSYTSFASKIGYATSRHAVGLRAEEDQPKGADYNYELQLALLLDGANIDDEGFLGEVDTRENPMPPEFFKREYFQLNLNEANKGYSDLPMHPRNAATVEIKREVPGNDLFSSGSMIKEIVRKQLSVNYRTQYGGRFDYGCTNYNSINLFQAFGNPSAGIVYPAVDQQYLPTSSFCIEFWCKLNRKPTSAGTVMHLPNGFALSLVTGSGVDLKGLPNSYRMLLQLDSNAYGSSTPETIDLSSITSDAPLPGSPKVFISSASIIPDRWNHCAVRWSPLVNNGTGSFFINRQRAGDFNLYEEFLFDSAVGGQSTNAPGLFIGGFWPGTHDEARGFFNVTASMKQGVVAKFGLNEPDGATETNIILSGGLDAEIHELRIWDRDVTARSIIRRASGSLTAGERGLMFYVPGVFDSVKASSLSSSIPANRYYAMVGDLTDALDSNSFHASASQFYEEEPVLHRASFEYPFNTHHANIGGFLNMNAQAYLREYVSGRYPYLHLMSDSLGGDYRSLNVLLSDGYPITSCHAMSSSWADEVPHQRRNLLNLPCDNGQFTPRFGMIANGDGANSTQYGISQNTIDYSFISLEQLGDFSTNYDSKLIMADEGFKYMGAFLEKTDGDIGATAIEVLTNHLVDSDGNDVDAITGQLMDLPNVVYFDALNFADRAESSSNMVNLFSVPILYYGNRIKPRSLTLNCQSMFFDDTAQGAVNITLKDDGLGGLYRADCSGSIATRNRVGDVYYGDGVIAIKNPALFSFGKFDYNIHLEGETNLYVYELNIPCEPQMLNSSSNPNYKELEPNDNANDNATKFVYISGINIHDDNLNVVAKARFAQPLVKKAGEKYLFRLRMDY
jgi:hypothetical protein